MYYNTLVALPMSLSLMKDRLQQRYYRQLEGWLGDVATIESNARAFCGDDSPVTEAAAGTYQNPLWNPSPLYNSCSLDQSSLQQEREHADHIVGV